MMWRGTSLGTAALILVLTGVTSAQRPGGAAWLVTSVDGSNHREQRTDILDTPVLPGSVAKVATLIAALETHVVDSRTTHLCRRIVTVNGRRYVCSHPDLKRPLTVAEALAYSCNDFFLSLARRLSPAAVEDVRLRLGLPRTPPAVDFPASLIGLDGARVSPRRLLDSFLRVVNPSRPDAVRLSGPVRSIVVDGLTGAARYGSASALNERGVTAVAKTGTAPMPGGGTFGIVLAATPPDAPKQAAVVIAPGAAGRDAAAIAADLLAAQGARIRIGHVSGTGRTRSEELDLEAYVARVVTGEGSPASPTAAQQALAIAARTFAIANRGRHADEGFDLCDTTHCQVTRPATSAARNAATRTAGLVLARSGRPVPVFYSAWCGGRSQLASNVWPDAPRQNGERPHEDEACAGEPAWTSQLSVVEIERALRAAGRVGDRLSNLSISRRDSSGRVATFRTEGFVPAEISGEDFRLLIGRVIGWERLKSTLVDISRTPRGFRFTGRGSGHGVGLCIVGARTRAARGASAQQILRFYYPDLSVTPMASLSAEPGRVIVAVPALEEGQRAPLLKLATSVRDEIAAAAGVPVPAEIRITAHPDADSFARTTGLPGWAAGAVRGTSIHLLPLEILRRQGQLERTVRHEMAHVLLDDALSGRPLWIREGAALTFARGLSSRAPTAPAECPSDEAIRGAVSSTALRDLYARAEACFRAQLAAGRKWTDVREPPSAAPGRSSSVPRRAPSAPR